MLVRTTRDLRGTKGEVKTEAWSSYRLLHAEDGMGVTRMRVVCTFVPPLVGGELHDADGSYAGPQPGPGLTPR